MKYYYPDHMLCCDEGQGYHLPSSWDGSKHTEHHFQLAPGNKGIMFFNAWSHNYLQWLFYKQVYTQWSLNKTLSARSGGGSCSSCWVGCFGKLEPLVNLPDRGNIKYTRSCPQKNIFLKQYKPGSSRTSSRKKLKSFEFEMSVNFVCECLQFILETVWKQWGFFSNFEKVDWFQHNLDFDDIQKMCDLILKGVDVQAYLYALILNVHIRKVIQYFQL